MHTVPVTDTNPYFWTLTDPWGKGLGTCYSATYMSQTRDQQRFAISEVAADWHKPMVPQRIMWPSTAHANGSCYYQWRVHWYKNRARWLGYIMLQNIADKFNLVSLSIGCTNVRRPLIEFYYQWRSNFSWKTFTRGREQYAHYTTPEKHVNLKNNFEVRPRHWGWALRWLTAVNH